MTREEAKRKIEFCRDFLANNYSDMGEPNFTAFNMAIEALSAEPCEDSISFPKGALKKRGKGYVVYNPEWLKENWQTELKVMGIECEDCISRAELLKAVDTWDKFGVDVNTKIVPVKECYVPYVHYDDIVTAIKGMPSVQSISKSAIEDIKAEIDKLPDLNPDYPMDRTIHISKWAVFEIIDKHIAERNDNGNTDIDKRRRIKTLSVLR